MLDRNELKLLADWNRALDPSAELDLTSEEGKARYVPFDDWPASDGTRHRLRGAEDVVEQLANQIQLESFNPHPTSTQLFAGFRGTGKTTELARLKRRLAGPDFAVISFDAQEYVTLNSAPTPEVLGLALAAGVATYAASELNIQAFAPRTLWKRFLDFLAQDVGDMELTLPAAEAELKVVLRETPDLADKLRRLLRNQPERLPAFLHDVVQQLANHVSPRQLVLLVDGLDKFVVPREQVGVVYRSMADLFFHHVNLLKIPACHVVYVIPPYLGLLHKGLAEAYGGRLRILPSLKVRERASKGGEENAAAIACLEEVVSRRVELDRLFGDARGAAMQKLALASGGHVRDLFNLLREVLRRAMSQGLPVALGDVDAAIDALSQDRGGLFRPTLTLLDEVRKSETLAALDDDQLGALSAAMDEYLVLSYRNGDTWYGVHPLIEPLLDQGLAALVRLKRAKAKGT